MSFHQTQELISSSHIKATDVKNTGYQTTKHTHSIAFIGTIRDYNANRAFDTTRSWGGGKGLLSKCNFLFSTGCFHVIDTETDFLNSWSATKPCKRGRFKLYSCDKNEDYFRQNP